MSSTAKAFNRKDGSGKVICIRHELALQPGLAVFEEYQDLKDGKVKLDGDNVVEFPQAAGNAASHAESAALGRTGQTARHQGSTDGGLEHGEGGRPDARSAPACPLT